MLPTPIHVEIILLESLAERWATWFEDLTLESLPGGATRLSGTLVDQAALHGCLERIRDLNLRLSRVQVEPFHD